VPGPDAPGTPLHRHATQISMLEPNLASPHIPTLAPVDWLPAQWVGSSPRAPLLQRAFLASAMTHG
jgi:hypothetical protein